jgi:hypothetical protein
MAFTITVNGAEHRVDDDSGTPPAPPKSSETITIVLLISRDSEHLQVYVR